MRGLGLVGQRIHYVNRWHQRPRDAPGKIRLRRFFRQALALDVPQQFRPVRRCRERRRGVVGTRKVVENSVDMDEVHAVPADARLLVDMSHEMQTVLADGDEVAGPVRAIPPELRDGCEGLRIVDEVEVVGEPNTADHKFAGTAWLDGVSHFIDDGRFPPSEWLPHQR